MAVRSWSSLIHLEDGDDRARFPSGICYSSDGVKRAALGLPTLAPTNLGETNLQDARSRVTNGLGVGGAPGSEGRGAARFQLVEMRLTTLMTQAAFF